MTAPSFTIRQRGDSSEIQLNGRTLPGVLAYNVNRNGRDPIEITITFEVNSIDMTDGPHFVPTKSK